MTIQHIINQYQSSNTLVDERVSLVLSSLRTDVVKHLFTNPNRKFALALLENVVNKRKNDHEEGDGDNIMLACYLLGMHGQVDDSLLICQAKNVDFDAFCYVDVQLVVFAGVARTLEHLDTVKTGESAKAIEYIKECSDAGDFDDLEAYFSKEKLPWWI